MSQEYKGQNLLDIAAKAEQDLASDRAKHGAQDGGFGGKTVLEEAPAVWPLDRSISFPYASDTI